MKASLLYATITTILPVLASARLKGESSWSVSKTLRGLLNDKMTDEERWLVINKYEWPECVHNHMTATQCKEFIDNEILTLNTGVHQTMRSVIIPKRFEDQQWYNAVAIPMYDNDLVIGRNGDGMIHYDFVWHSSGTHVTDAEDAEIPLTEIDPDTLQPVLVAGATLDGALEGSDLRPIAGGHYDPDAQSTLEGQRKLERALEEPEHVEPGDRQVGPWDCSGMSGVDCCLMIKHEVRDIDEHNHAIQCYLDYQPGTQKYYEQQYNSRVRIFENHEGKVSQVPYVG